MSLVSEWMMKGNINEFMNANIKADLLKPVCSAFEVPAFACH